MGEVQPGPFEYLLRDSGGPTFFLNRLVAVMADGGPNDPRDLLAQVKGMVGWR
jgi:hypothetical protein